MSSTRFQFHWKKKQIFKRSNKNLVIGKTHFNWYMHSLPHLITVNTTYAAKCKICNFMCEWISAVILKQIVRKRACKRLIFPAGEELAWDSQEAKWDEGLRGYRISLEGCWGVIPSVPLSLLFHLILKNDVERLGINLKNFLVFFYLLKIKVYKAKPMYSVQDYNRTYARELLA